jgi:flagellar hook-associated protein 2
MASVTSLGIGSNLDLSGLLTKLETAEKQRLVALQTRATSYTAKLSAYGTLQSSLSAFTAASTKLGDLNLYQAVKASSSFTTVLTATATSSAVAGNYAINVSQLAQAQSLATAGQASTTAAIGSGSATLTIDFGTFTPAVTEEPATPASFAVNASRTPVSIVIGEGANTLEGIRNAINGANAGVTASIVSDGSSTPNRLVLVSNQTGETSSMRLAVSGDNTAVGDLLNHDPVGTSTLTESAAARNAQLTVNGLAITSATNTVSESLQGVTLSLVKTGESTLTLARDTAAITTAVNAFVAAYNNLLSTGAKLTSYDVDTNTGSALTGDSTLRNMQVSIRQALMSPQSEGPDGLTMLSNIGVAFQKDGTLTVDAAKLEKALDTNLDGVGRLFAGTGAVGNKEGYGKQLTALAESYTAWNGALTNAQAGVTSAIKALDKQYDDTEVRINATVDRYRAQFTQLDLLMSKLNSTSTYLTAQFDAMNASKNN